MDERAEKRRFQRLDMDDNLSSRAWGELERPLLDSEWDAGDMGCGELVFQLRLRLKSMLPGQLLKLTARDPGAPEDLPAWCRLTGHHLTYADHPIYVIERKED